VKLDAILARAAAEPHALTEAELVFLLGLSDAGARAELHAAARDVRRRYMGDEVSVRGLVECSNICAKDCFYCGIRRSNADVKRYAMTVEELIDRTAFSVSAGYASVVWQGGEIESDANTVFYEDALRRARALSGAADLGVTLSLGEQTEETFRRWREAGAVRYLLRIETSDPAFYATLHPSTHSWERRAACLDALRRCGYQVGTGTMSGLPGQTRDMLARDVLFFAEKDVDMIGMGPYIPHAGTPLAVRPDYPLFPEGPTPEMRLALGLDMIAVTRLHLHDVNIAASTALQALADDGRERGILAGANVIMPNTTDVKYRRGYRLYDGKPSLDENAEAIRTDLDRRLAAIGVTIAYGRRGDSPHFRG